MNRILKEDPDRVHDKKNNKYYGLCSKDVITFGFFEDNVYWIANHNGCYTHCYLAQIKKIGPSRDYFEYPGRLWQKSKVISFWDYPSSKNELYKLLDKLGEETNIKFINNNWRVEVFDKFGQSTFIPVEKYTGEQYNPEEHDHVISPMKKKQKTPTIQQI